MTRKPLFPAFTSLSRRDFLKYCGATLCVAAVSTSLTGCLSSLSRDKLSAVNFDSGVASGDATQNALILWTRATPIAEVSKPTELTVAWELATEPEFSNIIRSGYASTSAQQDFTIKIDVQELTPGTSYYYRFVGASGESMTGRTATLPDGHLETLKLAVFSCSNYPAGYFNVYTEAAKQQPDAVIHLGDYIYEYGSDGYATENAAAIGRTLADNNSSEILTLEDYRRRYATYRQDKGLQLLHASAPWYLVWDDHEIANDTWMHGAENHQPETEGDFYLRRAAALQAYFEWLPVRPPKEDDNTYIYRSFDFGDLFSLHMLDTRIIGRSQQLNYRDYINPETGAFDQQRFHQDFTSNRPLLGEQQLNWLNQQLQASTASWQVLGQQVLMGRMHLPAEIIANPDISQAAAKIAELAQVKQRVIQARQQGLTPDATDVARLSASLPYNLDAWDGYPAEREMLYQQLKAVNKKLLVLAGDTHNAWYSTLTNLQGEKIGVEFATSSVSSPGMETYLQLNDQQSAQLAQALTLLIDDLDYCNLHQRGYLQLELRHEQVTADWIFIDNILSEDYQIAGQHRVEYRV
ncbi:alkaline phosphatase D family protein [Chromatiaceae bacterium AAb-1]|nr:alkaline phosphatase D family protein [Chromatiaceae bacterium AAb-1]